MHNSKLCVARCYHSGVLTQTEVPSRRGESVQLYSVQYRCVQYRCTLQYRAARCDQGCSVTYVGGGADNKNSDSASVALYLARGDLERLISLFNFFEPLFNFDLKLFKQTNSFSSS